MTSILPAMPASNVNNPEERDFWRARYWEAVTERDAHMDGFFVYAVLSTGVYCRPSCPSRVPKPENVVFFQKQEAAERAGFRACRRCRPEQACAPDPQTEIVRQVCDYIEGHLHEPVTLNRISREIGISPFHLQRTFKALLGITPRAYADARRLETLKAGLRSGQSVTQSLYDAGYGSSSRLYERANSQLGMSPASYRKHGANVEIRFTIVDSSLGPMLLAATNKGVCSIQFGDSPQLLETKLRDDFHSATISRDDAGLRRWVEVIIERLNGVWERDLPLDIRATAFQRLVWEHLRRIPPGKTLSYKEVAQHIGHPRAARAVARACASNPVAVAIPCHRIVREDGTVGGYRWGIERKNRLLLAEAASEGDVLEAHRK